jgi:sulfite exporter TauE/SafE
MSFWSYLALGLATSVHCVAMCGGLVLTYAVKGDSGRTLPERVKPHLAYQSAKILSYMVVALALGTLASLAGSTLDITGIRNWIMVLAGAYMVILGLAMTGAFPPLQWLTPRPPRFLVRALTRNRRKAMAEISQGEAGTGTPIVFGLLTGLMPCAPLMAAQAGALSAPSPLGGAALMLAFGLGTAPLMLVFGLATSALSSAFKRRMLVVAAVVVVLFGVIILNRGAMLVGSPVTFDSVAAAVTGTSTDTEGGYTVGADGVVEVSLMIRNTRFEPEVVRIPADSRVRLLVDRQEDNSCSDQVALPQLGVLQNVAAFAVTAVDLPATAAGTYTLTCGMGMMSGQLVVGAVSPDRTPLVMFLVGVVVIGLLLFVMRRRTVGLAREATGSNVALKSMGLSTMEAVLIAVAVVLAAVAGLIAGGVLQ